MSNTGTIHGMTTEHIRQLFEGQVCEACGSRAEYVAFDMAEDAPEPGLDEKGRPCLYVRWKEPEQHYFCADHKRPPRHTLRNGAVVEGTMV